MFTMNLFFRGLLTNIEPPDERLRAAKEIPANVRDFLKEAVGLVTASPHTRLAGSYARTTAIGDIKDVDIIVIVDSDIYRDAPKRALRALRDTLADFPAYLSDAGGAELRPRRRSVHVYFQRRDFHLDVVPAIVPNGIDEPLYVPDREWEEWIPSHPLGYGEFLSRINGDNSQKVVPLMKLFKHWRDVHMTYKRPKSYWLESIIVRHIHQGWVETEGKAYAEIVLALMDSVYGRFEHELDEGGVPEVPDPMLGSNVARNWKRDHFEAFMGRLDESRGWAARALEADTQNEAIRLWKKVFGEQFPDDVEGSAKSLADSLAGGFAVTASGMISTRPGGVRSVRPRPHTFHGESKA